jgi:hypothetical protein
MNFLFTVPTSQNYPQFDAAFSVGMLIGSLVAGVVCGLLPLAVAAVRGRPDWGIKVLGICVLAGLFGGVLIAGPVALAMTAAVLVSNPNSGAKRKPGYGAWEPYSQLPQDDGFAVPVPLVASPAGVTPTTNPPAATAAPNSAAPVSAPEASCSTCGAAILPCGDRLPPWCPKCGSDFRLPKSA